MERYDDGDCGVILASDFNVMLGEATVDAICERDLVRTQSIALEQPLGFAASSEHVAGVSYWMERAEDPGLSWSAFEEAAHVQSKCSLDVPSEMALDELVSLTPANFVLPFLVLIGCAVVAILIHFVEARRVRQREASLQAEEYKEQQLSPIGGGNGGNEISAVWPNSEAAANRDYDGEKRDRAIEPPNSPADSWVPQIPPEHISAPGHTADSARNSGTTTDSPSGEIIVGDMPKVPSLDAQKYGEVEVPGSLEQPRSWMDPAGSRMMTRTSQPTSRPSSTMLPLGFGRPRPHRSSRVSEADARASGRPGKHADRQSTIRPAMPIRRNTRTSILDVATLPEDIDLLQNLLDVVRETQDNQRLMQADQARLYAEQRKLAETMKAQEQDKKQN